MTLIVRLFARARELLGTDDVRVEVPDPATPGTLRQTMASHWPQLGPLLEVSRFAVNQDFADDTRPLLHTDEIALIPPVSGG